MALAHVCRISVVMYRMPFLCVSLPWTVTVPGARHPPANQESVSRLVVYQGTRLCQGTREAGRRQVHSVTTLSPTCSHIVTELAEHTEAMSPSGVPLMWHPWWPSINTFDLQITLTWHTIQGHLYVNLKVIIGNVFTLVAYKTLAYF